MRLTRVMIGFAATWFSIAAAQTTPAALFQQATLTGSNNTITATQIPVVTSSGTVIYLSATIQFNVDGNGNLTISGTPQITPAPTVINGSFKAGTYVGPSNVVGGKAIITISGPTVTSGGYTIWTLTTGSGADLQRILAVQCGMSDRPPTILSRPASRRRVSHPQRSTTVSAVPMAVVTPAA